MKTYKQLLTEVSSSIGGGKGGPSLGAAADADFGSIRGLGLNTGDSITANLAGRGFGKKQTTKDVTPEITAAIEAGKADGSIEEDENGKLIYCGIDGEFHNSPYAANEASTSFAKNLLQTTGMDPTVSEKGAETLVGLKKSGYLRYNYKEGKVYVNDNEVGSFDRNSKESIQNMTKKIPVNIMNGVIKSTLEETKPILKRLISRGNRSARKNATKLTTTLNSLINMLDNISDDALNAMLPTMLNGLSSISGRSSGGEAPPQQAYSSYGGEGRIPIRTRINPPGWRFRGGGRRDNLGGGARGIRPGGGGREEGGPPVMPPGWRYRNPGGIGTYNPPELRPPPPPPPSREDLRRMLDVWRLLDPWIPTLEDLDPYFPEGHPWHNPNQGSGQQGGGGPTQQGGGPQGPMGQMAGPEIKEIANTFNEVGNLVHEIEAENSGQRGPEQAQQRSGGPTEIPGRRWIWGGNDLPWWAPNRPIGPRPEFDDHAPPQPAPPKHPRDFRRWAYDRLGRWYQDHPGEIPPPNILDDWLYWDEPERRRKPKGRDRRNRPYWTRDQWTPPPGLDYDQGGWWSPVF